jgi:hypothetical protein
MYRSYYCQTTKNNKWRYFSLICDLMVDWSWNGCEELHSAPENRFMQVILSSHNICGIPKSMTIVRVGKSGIVCILYFSVAQHRTNAIQRRYSTNIKLMVWTFIGNTLQHILLFNIGSVLFLVCSMSPLRQKTLDAHKQDYSKNVTMCKLMYHIQTSNELIE